MVSKHNKIVSYKTCKNHTLYWRRRRRKKVITAGDVGWSFELCFKVTV
jgi:hypothetical protein